MNVVLGGREWMDGAEEEQEGMECTNASKYAAGDEDEGDAKKIAFVRKDKKWTPKTVPACREHSVSTKASIKEYGFGVVPFSLCLHLVCK